MGFLDTLNLYKPDLEPECSVYSFKIVQIIEATDYWVYSIHYKIFMTSVSTSKLNSQKHLAYIMCANKQTHFSICLE